MLSVGPVCVCVRKTGIILPFRACCIGCRVSLPTSQVNGSSSSLRAHFISQPVLMEIQHTAKLEAKSVRFLTAKAYERGTQERLIARRHHRRRFKLQIRYK